MSSTLTLEQALERAEILAAGERRVLLGIAGAPGSGKSTLAAAIAGRCGDRAAIVGMDGFHLAQRELERLGRAERKGAPDTFDASGYVALLRRVRDPVEPVVYAPEFRRMLEEPVASALAIPRELALVVTEGNYLLLDDGPWAAVRDLLDECWFVQAPEPLRLQRLTDRHVAYGRAPAAARAWALGPDQANARLIEATRGRAHAVIELA
ncbi:MAG: hypothetical protein QOF76_2997 [Solirubrobacteraceae bacterium]|nr:hypothetical protein [Solirubrobacteraceae bacterium]